MIAGIPFPPSPVTREGPKKNKIKKTTKKRVVKFQLHPQGKCLSSGINAAAAAACDSRLGGIYISGRTDVGKQNKQEKKSKSKRLQAEDDPEEG